MNLLPRWSSLSKYSAVVSFTSFVNAEGPVAKASRSMPDLCSRIDVTLSNLMALDAGDTSPEKVSLLPAERSVHGGEV